MKHVLGIILLLASTVCTFAESKKEWRTIDYLSSQAWADWSLEWLHYQTLKQECAKSNWRGLSTIDYCLEHFAGNNNIDAVKLLLSYGANPNSNSMIETIASRGHKDIVKMFLDAGVEVSSAALMWAACSGHKEIVEMLLNAGANTSDKPETFSITARKGYRDILELLLKASTDPKSHSTFALTSAAANGYTDIVKMALNAGADVHAMNDYALQWASSNKHTETVKILLAAGANVHAENDQALRWSAWNGHTEIMYILLEAGANPKVLKD